MLPFQSNCFVYKISFPFLHMLGRVQHCTDRSPIHSGPAEGSHPGRGSCTACVDYWLSYITLNSSWCSSPCLSLLQGWSSSYPSIYWTHGICQLGSFQIHVLPEHYLESEWDDHIYINSPWLVLPHVSCVTCNVSRVTCHVSHVKKTTLFLLPLKKLTKWWS